MTESPPTNTASNTSASSEGESFWTDERIAAVRADTPGTANVIHLNSAGSSLPPDPVHNDLVAHLELERRIGGYEAADAADEAVEAGYSAAAALLGCQPNDLAIVESATRAWSSALSAIGFEPGDKVLTTESEYVSNAMGLLRGVDRWGITIDVAPNDEHGQVDVAALESMIDDRTRVIALTHVPTQGGLVQPAAAVGAIAREAGVLYLLDACQSVGQLDVKVDQVNADILTFTGRKFLRGPRGTGMLYVRPETLETLGSHVGLDAGSSEWASPHHVELMPSTRRFTPFEMSIAGKVAMGTAFTYLNELGIDNVERRVVALGDQLRSKINAIDHLTVRDLGAERCGIVTFDSSRFSSTDIKQHLSQQSINVSVSSAGSAQFDLPSRGITDLVRSSVHYFNTDAELDTFIGALESLG